MMQKIAFFMRTYALNLCKFVKSVSVLNILQYREAITVFKVGTMQSPAKW